MCYSIYRTCLALFLSKPVSGKSAQVLGKGMQIAHGLNGIELFPKQSRLKTGPGSLVGLPFGIHRKTGQRYGFITHDSLPLASTFPEQIQLLSQPQAITDAAFRALTEPWCTQVGKTCFPASGGPRRQSFRPDQGYLEDVIIQPTRRWCYAKVILREGDAARCFAIDERVSQ